MSDVRRPRGVHLATVTKRQKETPPHILGYRRDTGAVSCRACGGVWAAGAAVRGGFCVRLRARGPHCDDSPECRIQVVQIPLLVLGNWQWEHGQWPLDAPRTAAQPVRSRLNFVGGTVAWVRAYRRRGGGPLVTERS